MWMLVVGLWCWWWVRIVRISRFRLGICFLWCYLFLWCLVFIFVYIWLLRMIIDLFLCFLLWCIVCRCRIVVIGMLINWVCFLFLWLSVVLLIVNWCVRVLLIVVCLLSCWWCYCCCLLCWGVVWCDVLCVCGDGVGVIFWC